MVTSDDGALFRFNGGAGRIPWPSGPSPLLCCSVRQGRESCQSAELVGGRSAVLQPRCLPGWVLITRVGRSRGPCSSFSANDPVKAVSGEPRRPHLIVPVFMPVEVTAGGVKHLEHNLLTCRSGYIYQHQLQSTAIKNMMRHSRLVRGLGAATAVLGFDCDGLNSAGPLHHFWMAAGSCWAAASGRGIEQGGDASGSSGNGRDLLFANYPHDLVTGDDPARSTGLPPALVGPVAS